MNFNIHSEKENLVSIWCTGEVESRKDAESLLSLLGDTHAVRLSITFLDANILPADVIERLDALQKSRKCKIYVLKRYLYSYLHSLGVKCEHVAKKSLYKRPLPIPSDPGVLAREEISAFLEDIYTNYGYDYTEYQLDSIMRRIKLSMLRENIYDFREFRGLVLEDVQLFEQLFLDFSINTTEFFRDPDVFLVIKNRILPYIDSYPHIKIWCVGCSNGKEAYSLAILLDELGLLDKTQIYATDINPYIIEEAKNGLYSLNDLDVHIINYKDVEGKKNFVDYFELKGNYIKIKKYLQKNVLFFQHSLVGSGILNEFQLILCRNVLIYFSLALQEKVLEVFYKSLDRNGFLVLGKSEGMFFNSAQSYFTRFYDKEKVYKVRQL